MGFQEIAEAPVVTPLAEVLHEVLGHARDTKETVVHYVQNTAETARKVSLPTIHFLQDSLGASFLAD